MHVHREEKTQGTFQDGVQSGLYIQVIFCTLLIKFSKIYLNVTIESRGLYLFIWSQVINELRVPILLFNH